jgi:hypothetical protein
MKKELCIDALCIVFPGEIDNDLSKYSTDNLNLSEIHKKRELILKYVEHASRCGTSVILTGVNEENIGSSTIRDIIEVTNNQFFTPKTMELYEFIQKNHIQIVLFGGAHLSDSPITYEDLSSSLKELVPTERLERLASNQHVFREYVNGDAKYRIPFRCVFYATNITARTDRRLAQLADYNPIIDSRICLSFHGTHNMAENALYLVNDTLNMGEYTQQDANRPVRVVDAKDYVLFFKKLKI